MVTLAGDWYTNGTFWAAMAVLVALVVGAATVWATLKANNPKLRLGYGLEFTTELLGHGSAGLTVTHNGVALSSPHVAVVTVTNEGRRDIVSSMFHNGDPLLFDLGGSVLGVLDVQITPSTGPVPFAHIVGATYGRVALDPCHLPRKQSIRISVVLDGPTSGIAPPRPLVNVDIRERKIPVMSMPSPFAAPMSPQVKRVLAAYFLTGFVFLLLLANETLFGKK
ncbi:hypothetical protein ABT096_29670 [Streptomyces sp. NPDC002561]|uniref:hypothetical protein n=1 Tax=Streptomyces sp. NPDC002561 TaxID=3154418 RepID=UPI003327E670